MIGIIDEMLGYGNSNTRLLCRLLTGKTDGIITMTSEYEDSNEKT